MSPIFVENNSIMLDNIIILDFFILLILMLKQKLYIHFKIRRNSV